MSDENINQKSSDGLFEIDFHFDFDPNVVEDYSGESYRFAAILGKTIRKKSLLWFGGKMTGHLKFVKDLRVGFNLPQISSNSIVANEFLGTEHIFENATRVSWSKSTFAKEFEKVLNEFGAVCSLTKDPQNPEFESSTGWGLISSAHPFGISGDVWRDSESGSEFIYWHFDALTHTRYFHLETHPAVEFFLPLLFQQATFLAESNNPDSYATNPDRKTMFGVDHKSKIPRIAIRVEKNAYRRDFFVNDDGNPEIEYNWSPETVKFGYVFQSVEDVADITRAIKLAFISLSRIASILVDGYCNHQDQSDDSFQKVTFSDDAIYEQGSIPHYARGKFVPGPIAIYSDRTTFSFFNRSYQLELEGIEEKAVDVFRMALNGYLEVISRGSGQSLPQAINDYVSKIQNEGGGILGLSERERQDFHDYGAELLRYATTMPVDLEDALAFSNLALLEISRKRYREALQAVNSGIMILKEDRSSLPVTVYGNSDPQLNPWIKLELFATRAELLYRAGEVVRAKDIAAKVLEEAELREYEGPEIEKVKWILAH